MNNAFGCLALLLIFGVTSFTDALGRTTDYEHDKLNRRTATIFPLLAGQTEQSERTTLLTLYDQLGRRVAETNQDGIITRYGYDGLGRLTVVTNADGTLDRIETRYVYDELGNLLEQEDALHRKTKFLYDKLGRRIRRTLPEGQTELSFYDAIGNRTKHTNFIHSQVLEFEYDTFGRLLKKFESGQENTPIVEFTYNLNGQRLTMNDQAPGHVTYEYNPDDRLFRKTIEDFVPSVQYNPYIFQYTYDLNGNLTSLQAGSHQIQYQWDALNRLTNVVDQGLSTARKNTAYTYDDVGNLQRYEYPNLVVTTYEYDNLNRLKEMGVATGGNPRGLFQYELLKSGHRKNLTEEVNGLGRQVLYGYDPLYRLVGETNANVWPQPWYPVPEVFYDEQPGYSDLDGYDRVGNRHKRSAGFGWGELDTRTYAYNGNDWLTDHTYDANGNTRQVTAVPDQTDEYDLDNRLIKRTTSGQVLEFVYDGDGNRVQKRFKTPAGQTEKTIYYLVDHLNPTGYAQVWEQVAFGTEVSEDHRVYTYGHDLITQSRPSATGSPVHFYGFDGLGSVRFLTDTSGNITDTYTYDAFGILIYIDGAGTPNNYLFAGQQWDPDLRMYYLRARYLEPGNGRFWTMDKFEGVHENTYSLHKYLYAHGNPINNTDPTGMMTWEQFLGYDAEDAIQEEYLAMHPAEAPFISFGMRQYFSKGGTKSFLKPDIFVSTPGNKRYLEIKPISVDGVTRGAAKMIVNFVAFGPAGYKPDISWQPLSPVMQTSSGEKIFVINVGGIVFYQDLELLQWQVITVGAVVAGKDLLRYLKFEGRMLVRPAMARITLMAAGSRSADAARLQMHVGIASLLAVIGGALVP